jgi:hypothetical protein
MPGSDDPTDPAHDPARALDLLLSHRAIEQHIYRIGYALEAGDFAEVGRLLQHATLGADLIGRRAFKGADEIRAQYERTNIVYPEGGRRSREIYHNVLVDIDLDLGAARSTTAYTVGHQGPDAGDEFHLLVAGRYEDEWARVDGEWRIVDRYLTVQFKNNLDRHMHPGSQPYN